MFKVLLLYKGRGRVASSMGDFISSLQSGGSALTAAAVVLAWPFQPFQQGCLEVPGGTPLKTDIDPENYWFVEEHSL